ncbi:MAG: hypothetical protein ACOY30_04795 [Bacillota bacterium]
MKRDGKTDTKTPVSTKKTNAIDSPSTDKDPYQDLPVYPTRPSHG